MLPTALGLCGLTTDDLPPAFLALDSCGDRFDCGDRLDCGDRFVGDALAFFSWSVRMLSYNEPSRFQKTRALYCSLAGAQRMSIAHGPAVALPELF